MKTITKWFKKITGIAQLENDVYHHKLMIQILIDHITAKETK